MKPIKLTYIVSHIDKANEFEWLIDGLNRTKYELIFVSVHTHQQTALAAYCAEYNVPFYHIQYNSKKNIFRAIFQLYKLLRKLKPSIVHAHLFEGGLIGITAAWLAGIKHRIYTRHYSNYHHIFFPNGLKYDKWINRRSTHIISITKTVSQILIDKELVPSSKITLIHHGFPLDGFKQVSEERMQDLIKRNRIPKEKTIIGVVSRYTFWKGVQDIIPAFKKYNQENPNAHLVLANAKGDYADTIEQLLQTLPKDSYTEIVFENDNVALFKSFDMFIHVPIDNESEAFGQIYIEAFLAEVPCIFTLSGIANEIVRDGVNAMVVPHQNSEAIYNALNTLKKDPQLSTDLVKNALITTAHFSFDNKMKALEKLYSNLK